MAPSSFFRSLPGHCKQQNKVEKEPVESTEESTQSSSLLLQRFASQIKAKWPLDLWRSISFGFRLALGCRCAACRQMNMGMKFEVRKTIAKTDSKCCCPTSWCSRCCSQSRLLCHHCRHICNRNKAICCFKATIQSLKGHRC